VPRAASNGARGHALRQTGASAGAPAKNKKEKRGGGSRHGINEYLGLKANLSRQWFTQC